MEEVIKILIEKYGNNFKGATSDNENNIFIFKKKKIIISNDELDGKITEEIIELIEEELNK